MGKSDSASTSLAPGFRFHPTDEELVSYYLKRKVCGKSFRFDAIAEIDIYRVEPWDLPGLSKLKSRDLEWYFFSGLDKKYGNGSRTNRATGEGYWKTTGKDRLVHHRSHVVGMKKTLVYHHGRAPRGKRTNWVMHEYKLVDEALEKSGVPMEGVVLCRVFQKSGPGPKNGEQYGAPFAEEEWENDEVVGTVPGEVSFEEPFAEDDAFIEQNDLDQSLDLQIPGDVPAPENVAVPHEDNSIPLGIPHEGNSIPAVDFRDIAQSEEKYLVGDNEYRGELQVLGDQQFLDLAVQGMNNAEIVRNEHMVQPNNVTNAPSANCLPNEPVLDTAGNELFDDGLFLDAIDFLDPAEENPLNFNIPEEFMYDDIDIRQYLNFDAPPSLTSDDTDQTFLAGENSDNATWPAPMASQQLPAPQDDGSASSSRQAFEDSKPTVSKSAIQYPCLSQASRLLGNIPAPPAFASELPSKDMAAQLNAAMHSSSSVHVTAGMIRIRDVTIGGGSRLQWSLDKTGNVNVLLSFELPEDVSRTGLSSILSRKVTSAFSRGWLCSMLWVLVFAFSFKVGSFIYAK